MTTVLEKEYFNISNYIYTNTEKRRLEIILTEKPNR